MEGKIHTRNNVQGVAFQNDWAKLYTEDATLKDGDWVTFSTVLVTPDGRFAERMTTGNEIDVAIHVKKEAKVPPTLYPTIFNGDHAKIEDGIYLVILEDGTTRRVAKDSVFGFDGLENVEYYYTPKLS
jgi:hypothetical protein